MTVAEKASSVDQGWAWVVCAAGSFLHIMVVGTIRSTGLLLANVSEHFNRSKRDTSWILSLMFLVYLMLTPITMSLSRRYSVRLIVTAGSGFLASGFALSYFAESLELLYLTIGLLVGTGLSMTHPPTVLLISYYFKRHRTVAMGFAMAGCSIGALCMPPLMNALIEDFTFRGGMLLWGGMMLNVAVAAALMRPFVAEDADQTAASAPLIDERTEENAENSKENGTNDAIEKIENHSKENKPLESADCCVENEEHFNKNGRTNYTEKSPKSGIMARIKAGDVSSRYFCSANNILGTTDSADAAAKPGGRRRSISATAPSTKATSMPAAVVPYVPPILLSSCGDVSILPDSAGPVAEPCGEEKSLLSRLRSTMAESAGLMHQFRFWLLLFSLSLAIQGMPLNFMILPQHGKSIGMTSSEYTRLLQYQGISDLAVRVGIGFLSDRQLIRRQLLLVVLVIGQGALWCLLLYPTPGAALAFSLLEGALAGGLVTNLAPILVDRFGVEHLPLTYGVLGVLESGTMISVPVLLGDMFDKTGSWRSSVIFLSVFITVSGLLLLADDLLGQRDQRRKQLKSEKTAAADT